jgi:hypothetical protein
LIVLPGTSQTEAHWEGRKEKIGDWRNKTVREKLRYERKRGNIKPKVTNDLADHGKQELLSRDLDKPNCLPSYIQILISDIYVLYSSNRTIAYAGNAEVVDTSKT